MALVAPGVNYVQLPGKSTTPLAPRFQNFHTMVGTLLGSQSWFSPGGRPYSHFGVGTHEIRQWQDLRYKAASDLYGNPWSISWETQDMGPEFGAWGGSNVPPWTDRQLDMMAPVAAWNCARFGIPPVDVGNSLPIPHGQSIHRYGIDPYRIGGGLYYSSSYGKACPGDRRVHQFKTELVPEIARLVRGGAPSTPTPDSTVPVLEPDMKYVVKKKTSPRVYLIVGKDKFHLNTSVLVPEAAWLFGTDVKVGTGNTPLVWPDHWVDLFRPARPGIDNSTPDPNDVPR